MAKHKLLPSSATPERIGGHSWAGDGMEPTFFSGGGSSNTRKEKESLVLVPGQMTQVQEQDRCTATIGWKIRNERTSLNQRVL